MQLTRYWFTFDISAYEQVPPGVVMGCGVTAFDLSDAIGLLDEKVFRTKKRPPFKDVKENVDVRTLDQGHVVVNMRPPNSRGIWFPMGYE